MATIHSGRSQDYEGIKKMKRQILTWNNLKNISKPLIPYQIKTVAVVLTQKGVGSVLCPKCNILNLVRDGIFRSHCGFKSNIVDCACDVCGQQLLDRDR